jgi:predicted TPR repeat methyltransferase
LVEDRLKFYYLKAKAAMESKNFRRASEEFLSMVEIAPNLDFAHYNLASCYVELGRWRQAYDHYHYALSLKGELSQDADLFFNLGVCAERLNQPEHAERFYQEATELNPRLFAAHFNVGLLTASRGKAGLAMTAFERAAVLQPDSPEVAFHLARLAGENLPQLPRSHVQSLFDRYADHYDLHLQGRLNYVLPEVMVDLLNKSGVLQGDEPLNVLDLGCGTGLVAEAWSANRRRQGDHFDGVDLSSNMLAIAQEKGRYRQLCCEDLLNFLKKAQSSSYQGVLAAEVLNYFGDLSIIFDQVSRVLNPGGWFCFSVEEPPAGAMDQCAEGWSLLSTLRYAHNQSYVKSIALGSKFQEVVSKECWARNQEGTGMVQRLFLLRR